MALAAFDTLEFVDELEKAGVPDQQARAISVAVRKAHESSDVATKADIAELRHEIKESASAIKFDLLKWIVGLAAGNFIFMAGIFWKVMSIPGVH